MNKRQFLLGTGGLLAAGAALQAGQSTAAETDDCGRAANPATFVLVPGAWCGGFVYDDVAAILRRRGHRVFTPTLTGLCERAHLLTPEVDLSVHIEDVVNVIRFNELEDVVLAGHSYGGMSITGAADRLPERVAALVYLDAVVPEDGQSAAGAATGKEPPAEAAKKRPLASPMPPSVAEEFGIPAEERWRYTPQPGRVGVARIRLTGAHESVPKKTYVRTQWGAPSFDKFHDRAAADPAWTGVTVDTGHMLMLDDPQRTAEILQEAAPEE